jgi:hypothetical protein
MIMPIDAQWSSLYAEVCLYFERIDTWEIVLVQGLLGPIFCTSLLSNIEKTTDLEPLWG